MSQTPHVQNKPLLIAVIIIALSIGLGVAWFASTHGLSRADALARANALMQSTCARECAAHKVTQAELHGPEEAPTNAQDGNTKFDFKWKAPNGYDALIVRVWDNGLYVESKSHWIDERKDKSW